MQCSAAHVANIVVIAPTLCTVNNTRSVRNSSCPYFLSVSVCRSIAVAYHWPSSSAAQLLSFSATQPHTGPTTMTGYNFVDDRPRPRMSASPHGQAPDLGLAAFSCSSSRSGADDDGIRPSTRRRRRSQEIKQRL